MRARPNTSTVLGTSTIARAVRVAVTTTRWNSVASGMEPASGEGWAAATGERAAPKDNNKQVLGRIASSLDGSRAAAGVRLGRVAGVPGSGKTPGRRPPGLFCENQFAVAGVAQAVALGTVADQDLALALQQAFAVQLALAPGHWPARARCLIGGAWNRWGIWVRVAGKHREYP